MRIRTAVATVSASTALACSAGCGAGLDRLPAASGSGPPTVYGVVVADDPAPTSPAPLPRVPAYDIPQDASGHPVPTEPVTDAAEELRFVIQECTLWASLSGRDRAGPRPPSLDADRAAGAVVLAHLRSGTDLVRDGRGTRLVLVDWPSRPPDLRDERGGPAPEPYRSACPPDRTSGA